MQEVCGRLDLVKSMLSIPSDRALILRESQVNCKFDPRTLVD